MRIKAEPDADGMIRFRIHDEAIEIATLAAIKKAEPAAKPPPAPPPSPPPPTKQGRDWRRGYPAFQIAGTLDEQDVSAIIEALHADLPEFPSARAIPVVVGGVKEFDAESMKRLFDTIDTDFSNLTLVIDLDRDFAT